MLSSTVKVAVRIRDVSGRHFIRVEEESSQVSTRCLYLHIVVRILTSVISQISVDGGKRFTFDHVFGPEESQQRIYNACVQNLVEAALEGINATILAYGQTVTTQFLPTHWCKVVNIQ